jgi:uracil-DNA glycosylase
MPALMFVGEQPGDQEDLRAGPSSARPASCSIARWRRPASRARRCSSPTPCKHFKFELRGKRRIHKTPRAAGAAACLHWLEDEIALVQPQALVALGATAARSLLGHAVRC